jgi:hypothetical protein
MARASCLQVDQNEYSRWSADEQRQLDEATDLSQYLGLVSVEPLKCARLQLNLQSDLAQRVTWADRLFPSRELRADSITGFQALQVLDVQNCGLEQLSLPPLPLLKTLVVSYNHLTTLSGIGASDTLQMLTASHNHLGSLGWGERRGAELFYDSAGDAAAAERDALRFPSMKRLSLEQNCELCVGTLCDVLVALPLRDLNICGTKDELASHAQLTASFKAQGNAQIRIKVDGVAARGRVSAPTPPMELTIEERQEYERVGLQMQYEQRLTQQQQEAAQLASQLDEASRTAGVLQVERDAAAASLARAAAQRDSVERDAALQKIKLLEAARETRRLETTLLQQQEADVAVAQAAAAQAKANQRKCVICLDEFDASRGVECTGEMHFVCGDCFGQHVKVESEKELDQLHLRNGRVFCPCHGEGGCDVPPYTDATIAVHVDEATFGLYTGASKRLLENRLAKEMEADKQQQLKDELERLQRMTEEQRLVDCEKRRIEEMLNPQCPRCRVVFIDFLNCAALTCGNAGCDAKFCAWCLRDCGDDAHRHVAECLAKPDGADVFYDTKQQFMDVQRQQQRAKITGVFQELNEALRGQVAIAVGVVLEEVGLGDITARFAAGQ